MEHPSEKSGAAKPGDRGQSDQPAAGRRLLASSATVSLFNALGVLAGFALDAAIAAVFGLGSDTDAFFAAWRIPNLVTVVVALAAGAALVPIFTRALAEDDGALSQIASRVFNAVALIMLAVSLLGIVLSPWLVDILYGGLPAASRSLATSLSRILFLTVLFTGCVEVLRALLYAHQAFALPTAINFVRSLVTVVVLLAGQLTLRVAGVPAARGDWIGLHVLAWGWVAGVMAQLLVVGWQTWRQTAVRWLPLFDPRHPALRQTARLSAAPTAGALVRQSITLAETAIASYLPPGSVTVLSYANRLTFVLSSVFLSSVTTASMPMLSRSIRAQRWQEVRDTTFSALRLVTFLALPLGVGLFALGVPLIRLFFERGRFTAEASQLTGAMLSLYAFSIVSLGYFRVVQAYFYAALKAHVVLALFLIMAAGTIGLDLWLVGPLGVRGIAVGFSVGTLLATVPGLWLLHREARNWTGVRTAGAVRRLILLNLKVAVASALMAVTAVGLLQVLPDAAWSIVPAVTVGLVVFVAAARLLRVRELQLAADIVRPRLRRK